LQNNFGTNAAWKILGELFTGKQGFTTYLGLLKNCWQNYSHKFVCKNLSKHVQAAKPNGAS